MKIIIIFGIILLFPFQIFASECPQDFIQILEENKETNLYKKTIAETCTGYEAIVTGEVFNVDIDDELYIVKVNSSVNKKLYEVDMRPNIAVDMLKIKKGDIVTVKGKMKRFGGYLNRYIELEDGVFIDGEP